MGIQDDCNRRLPRAEVRRPRMDLTGYCKLELNLALRKEMREFKEIVGASSYQDVLPYFEDHEYYAAAQRIALLLDGEKV